MLVSQDYFLEYAYLFDGLDVIVHRLLQASIEEDAVYGQELTNKDKMRELCDGRIISLTSMNLLLTTQLTVLNLRHRMAQQAGRSSVELFTNMFFKNKVQIEEGRVIRILKNGFSTLVPK